MASNLAIVNDGDSFPYTSSHPPIGSGMTNVNPFYYFYVADTQAPLGYILPVVVEVLKSLPNWTVDDATCCATLAGGNNSEERSEAMERVVLAMKETGRFEILKQWRHETFPIYGPRREILFHLERCACPLFGVVTYGVHALAYVPPQADGEELKVWVSRRARTKQTYGGMLDSTAAGGIASREMPLETLVKECQEEASLSPEFVRMNARASSIVTHFYVRDERAGGESEFLQPECQYVYDLVLPPHIICEKNDGEVDGFHLWTVNQVKQALGNREFKPNSAMVMLDFLIRHGYVTPENEMDYLEIACRLRRRLEFPMR